MLGWMVRFDFGFAGEAEDILMTALTMRVQRTHRREHRSMRRTREDIVALADMAAAAARASTEF